MRIVRFVCLCLLGAAALRGQTVSCLVAVVNGHLITLIDVEIVAEFGLAGRPPEGEVKDPKFAALDALIDRKVVLDMTREARAVDREAATAVLGDVRGRLGEDEFGRRLRKFGLEERDLRPYIEEMLLFEMALALRFSRSLPVPGMDIEKYYREVYAPGEVRRGQEPQSLDRVTGLIEARLRARTLEDQTSAWIKDLRGRADIRINKDCLK